MGLNTDIQKSVYGKRKWFQNLRKNTQYQGKQLPCDSKCNKCMYCKEATLETGTVGILICIGNLHGRECDLGKNCTATGKLHEMKPSAI